jgi:hypothetical protein
MSKDSATVIKDGQLAVATVPQTGTLVGAASEIDATALVETDEGLQLCIKTCEVGGGGGGGGTVDQTYNPTSTNAQSGTAVAEAVAPALKNTATGDTVVSILGTSSVYKDKAMNIGLESAVSGNYDLAVGYNAKGGAGRQNTAIGTNSTASNFGTALGYNSEATGEKSYAIGRSAKATADYTIQLGEGTNSTANSFQVFTFQMLDGTTGLIPAARIGTGYDATKTQVLKNVNGTLTWVDE